MATVAYDISIFLDDICKMRTKFDILKDPKAVNDLSFLSEANYDLRIISNILKKRTRMKIFKSEQVKSSRGNKNEYMS